MSESLVEKLQKETFLIKKKILSEDVERHRTLLNKVITGLEKYVETVDLEGLDRASTALDQVYTQLGILAPPQAPPQPEPRVPRQPATPINTHQATIAYFNRTRSDRLPDVVTYITNTPNNEQVSSILFAKYAGLEIKRKSHEDYALRNDFINALTIVESDHLVEKRADRLWYRTESDTQKRKYNLSEQSGRQNLILDYVLDSPANTKLNYDLFLTTLTTAQRKKIDSGMGKTWAGVLGHLVSSGIVTNTSERKKRGEYVRIDDSASTLSRNDEQLRSIVHSFVSSWEVSKPFSMNDIFQFANLERKHVVCERVIEPKFREILQTTSARKYRQGYVIADQKKN